jgi:hypothetical protein
MAYTYKDGVDETKPVASSTPANSVAPWTDIKKAYNERLDDIMGTTFKTDDPVVPTKYGPDITIQGSQVIQSIYDAGDSGSSIEIDFDNGNFQKLKLTANCTLSVTNMKAGSNYTLLIQQDATGGRTLTFDSDLIAPSGATLPFNKGANSVSVLGVLPWSDSKGLLIFVGTNYNVA